VRSARVALMDAATRVFAERGYDGASVDGIVKAAGLSKGTFYWHFAGKEDLFHAVIEERIDAPARSLMEVTRTAPADAVTAPVVSQGLADLFRGSPQLLALLQEYARTAARSSSLRRRYRRRQRVLTAALADALRARHVETGVPLTMPAERLARAFIALAHGLAIEAAITPEDADPELFGEILALVYDGIASRA
jgi:AcrR family transcriptional regulator